MLPDLGSPKTSGSIPESESSSGFLDISFYPYEGSPVDGNFAIMNTGSRSITILSISLAFACLPLLASWGFPNNLPPGGTGDFAITSSGDLRGTSFHIETSAGTFGPYVWPFDP